MYLKITEFYVIKMIFPDKGIGSEVDDEFNTIELAS